MINIHIREAVLRKEYSILLEREVLSEKVSLESLMMNSKAGKWAIPGTECSMNTTSGKT